jgi:four helix bundle protein
MSQAKTFRDLEVWKLAHQFVLSIYKLTEGLPKHEMFGLTSQLRRAAVSVPANIAEGFKKRTPADKAKFYNISQGSLEECRYYLILIHDLQYAETTQLQDEIDRIARVLDAYMKAMLEGFATAR